MNTTNLRKKLGIALLSIAILSACSTNEDTSGVGATAMGTANVTATETVDATGTADETTTVATGLPASVEYEEEDVAMDWSGENPTMIDLSAEVGPVNITAAGTYVLSGTLEDGGVIVDIGSEDKVRLVLNGVEIHNETGSAIDIKDGEKVFITLEEGTQNSVSDGATYTDTTEDAPNAAIYSKADLVVNGTGSLSVEGNYKDGLTSRDDLMLVSGSIAVKAVDDGVVGRDVLAVQDGVLTVDAGGDGLKSTNDTEEGKGNIAISGGELTIEADGDGLQAAVSVRIDGGMLDIVSGGGSANGAVHTESMGGGRSQASTTATTTEDTPSTKAIKATSSIVITAGTIQVDAADDAVHSNVDIVISGGELTASSGDDGIHADASILVEGGRIDITKSYEGIESSVITVVDGEVSVTTSDDGFNISGGNDGSSVGGRAGQNAFAASSGTLTIEGGTITVNAQGDGLDSNGSILMSGGTTVVINGSTSPGDGAIDYNGTFNLSGGSLFAVGSGGMAMSPSETSTQASILMSFSGTQAAGTEVQVKDADGNVVASSSPSKAFQTLLISAPDLKQGGNYTLFTDSSEVVTFEVAQSITWLNESGVTEAQSGFGGGFGGGGGGGGGGQRPAGGMMQDRPAR